MKVEIMLHERAMAAAGLRSMGGPLHGPKPIKQTVAQSRYEVTLERAWQVVAALEGCKAYDEPEKPVGRDPDVETDKYAVRIAAAMVRRALANTRPA